MLLDNYIKWCIAKNIFTINNTNTMTLPKLAREINISYSNPYFHSVINFLIENKAIIILETVAQTRFIKINHNVLKKLLEDSKIFDEVSTFIANKTGGLYKI